MSTDIRTYAGTEPKDPTKSKSYEAPPLKQKIEELVEFVNQMKYGMLTTKMSTDSNLLTSRCMAVAGTVSTPCRRIETKRKRQMK